MLRHIEKNNPCKYGVLNHASPLDAYQYRLGVCLHKALPQTWSMGTKLRQDPLPCGDVHTWKRYVISCHLGRGQLIANAIRYLVTEEAHL